MAAATSNEMRRHFADPLVKTGFPGVAGGALVAVIELVDNLRAIIAQIRPGE